MKEVLTILKYGLKGSGIFARKKQGKGIPAFIIPLIFILAFGIPMYLVLRESFSYLLNTTSVAQLEFIVTLWCFFLTIISITTLFPFIIYSLIKNEEIEMLLSFPIAKGSIIVYQTILTLMSESFLTVFFLFGFLAYTDSMGYNRILSIFTSLTYVLLLISLSMLLAVVLGRFMGKHHARKVHMIMYFINILLFVLFSQMNPSVLKNMSFEDALKRLTSIKKFIMNPLNPAYLPILAIKHITVLLIMILLVMILFILVYRLSEDISFEMTYKKRKKEVAFSERSGKALSTFSKDFKIFFRNEHMVFMMFYSIGFPLIYTFFSKDFSFSFPLMIYISSFYAALASAFLSSQEFLVIPLSKSFPVRLERLFLPKLLIPTLLYTLIYMIFSIIYISMTDNLFVLLTVPFTFLLYLFSSYLGIRFYLKKPTTNTKKVISGARIYVLEGLILLVGLFTSIAIYLYVCMRDSLVKFLGESFASLVGLALPTITSLFLIFYISRGMKRISDIFSRLD